MSWHPHYAICTLRWWVSEWESTSIRRERLLEMCLEQNGERCSRHSEAQWQNEGIFEGGRKPTKGRSGTRGEMVRQNIKRSQWVLKTERSISFILKEGVIIPCTTSILRRRLPFHEGIFQFWTTIQEHPESAFAKSNRETERSNTVHDKSKKFGENWTVVKKESRFRGTRTMPYTPVSCETGHSFRGTRTMPYTPVSCETGHSFRGTRTILYAYWGCVCQSERAPA